MGNARLKGEGERLGIHIGDHQDVAGRRLRGDADDEPVGIETRREDGTFFERMFEPRAPK